MILALIYEDGAGTFQDSGKRKRAGDGYVPLRRDQLAAGKPWWVPVVDEITDTSTGTNVVASPWVTTIEAGRVLRSRSIRDKTAPEVDADKTAAIEERFTGPSSIDRVIAEILFAHENRIRVLEGLAPITVAQFKNYLKSQLGVG